MLHGSLVAHTDLMVHCSSLMFCVSVCYFGTHFAGTLAVHCITWCAGTCSAVCVDPFPAVCPDGQEKPAGCYAAADRGAPSPLLPSCSSTSAGSLALPPCLTLVPDDLTCLSWGAGIVSLRLLLVHKLLKSLLHMPGFCSSSGLLQYFLLYARPSRAGACIGHIMTHQLWPAECMIMHLAWPDRHCSIT